MLCKTQGNATTQEREGRRGYMPTVREIAPQTESARMSWHHSQLNILAASSLKQAED